VRFSRLSFSSSPAVYRLFLFLILWLAGCSGRPDDPPLSIDPESLGWIGTQVFKNECGGRKACLVHWNEGEAFLSLGIGHFIWYPENVNGPFVESFPAMIRYLSDQGIVLPAWLEQLTPFDAPWPTRSKFLEHSQSGQMRDFREFLLATKGAQAGFLVYRASGALDRVAQAAAESQNNRVVRYFHALAKTAGGAYALIDYVNFKGEGLVETERYNGEGWGLLQVLLAMDGPADQTVLVQFRDAAAKVLTQRAENSGKAIEKERWLPGWLNRLDTYREPY
jgi:hypothetical protein